MHDNYHILSYGTKRNKLTAWPNDYSLE